jgi:hypothetical protein
MEDIKFELVDGITSSQFFVVGYKLDEDNNKIYLRNLTNGGGVTRDGIPFIANAGFVPDEIWNQNHPKKES